MKKVLLILDNKYLQESLIEALRQEYEVTVCTDTQTVDQLLQQNFDGLILEMSVDNLSLLERFYGQLPPAIIVLTWLLCEDIMRTSDRCGVNYLVRLPCPICLVKDRLAQLLNDP